MEIRAEGPNIPSCMAWHVRRALLWIPAVDLIGLETIRLFERYPGRNRRTGEAIPPDPSAPPYYLGGKASLGFYSPQHKTNSLYIGLNAEVLFAGMPRFFNYTPVVTFRFARVLAHEVAHHLVRTQGYIFNPHESYEKRVNDPKEESMAELYATKICAKMRRRFSYKLADVLSRTLGTFYYSLGTIALEKQLYRRASYYFYCACQFNEGDDEAGRWWRNSVAKVRELEETGKANQTKVQSAGASTQRPVRRRL